MPQDFRTGDELRLTNQPRELIHRLLSVQMNVPTAVMQGFVHALSTVVFLG